MEVCREEILWERLGGENEGRKKGKKEEKKEEIGIRL